MTKKYKRAFIFLSLLSAFVLLAPFCGYLIAGFIAAAPITKLALSASVFVAAIATVLGILLKFHVRSTLFIVLLGLTFALENIVPCLVLICLATILDEFIISPAAKHYKNKWVINNELDKRESEK